MGTKHHSIIELNGKRYNAHTGTPMSDVTPAHPVAPVKHAHPVHHDIKRPAAAKQVHNHPERSKTLMRHAVKKPGRISSPKTSAVTAVAEIKSPVASITALNSTVIYRQDAAREKRAQKIRQSELVRKFSHGTTPLGLQPVTKKIQPLAVQPAPALTHHVSPFPNAEKLIERGLLAAQSHTASHHSKGKRHRKARFASISAASMAVLLLGVFFTMQNIPSMSVRYAASKAGVSAQLPGYRPSGFSLSNRVEYTPGHVTINFSSNSDERAFTLTQRNSTWSSETLMSNYVASNADQFQTFEDKGRTIYLYGDSHATWVNGGVWYEIDGNAQLTSDQLIRIATSI